MTHQDEKPTLVGHICEPFFNHVIKKSLLGGPYVSAVDLLKVETLVYLIGAVLGRALRDRLNILSRLFFIPGTEENHIKKITALCKKDARKNLKEFQSQCGREPRTFDDFIFYRGIEGLLSAESIQMSPRDAYEAYLRADKKLRKVLDQKVDAKGEAEERVARRFMQLPLLQGVFFGSSFPELTQTMYQKAWEHDRGFWTRIWPHGLVMPEEFKAATLEEAETIVLLIVADYASKYYPELIDGLGLMSVIHEAGSGRYGYQPYVDPLLHKRLQELSSVEEQHNAELEDFWNSTSPDECASLVVSFLDELRHNWSREYSQLNPERLPDAISKGFKDGITRAYKVGYMRGKGWISQEHLTDFILYLGDKLAREVIDVKGTKSNGNAFAAGYTAVSVQGTLSATRRKV